MRKSKTIRIGGREITVKELRVKDIRAILEDAGADGPPAFIDLLFPDSLGGRAVQISTGLSAETLDEDFTPSQLEALLAAVDDVNPHFAAMAERLAALGRAASATSTPPSAAS